MSRIKLKLCGNHSLDDLKNSINSRADYIGVVFAESKRMVSPRQLSEWLKSVQLKSNQKLVAIFVNASPKEIKRVVERVPIDIIQAHGTETMEDILQIKEATSLPIWKAIHHSDEAIHHMKKYEGLVDGYVVDAKVSGQWGGSGKSFNWETVPQYLKEAKKQHVPCFIAGGVTPDNVGDLLPYEPDGIDLSSGIEVDGRKNINKIRELEERLSEDDAAIS